MSTPDDELVAVPATTQQITRAFIDFHRTRAAVRGRLVDLKVAMEAGAPEEVAQAMLELDGAANAFAEHCHAYSQIANAAHDSWIWSELDSMVEVVRGRQSHAATWLVTQCKLGAVHPTFAPYLRGLAARLGSGVASKLAPEHATAHALEPPTDSYRGAPLRRGDSLVPRGSIRRRFLSWCRRALRFVGYHLRPAQDSRERTP
jgi:hypothetical protein